MPRRRPARAARTVTNAGVFTPIGRNLRRSRRPAGTSGSGSGCGRGATPGGTTSTSSPSPATFGTSTSNNYRKTFSNAHPQTKGKVVVHHAVEQQVMKRYPGVVSKSEMNSLENLRGIPKGSVNNRVHLSAIRKDWNKFYKKNPNPTKQELLDQATKIDDKYGKQFNPPIR